MCPTLIRLASCFNLVKHPLNLHYKSFRSLAYTTYSDVSDSSSDTNVLCHPLEKLGKFKITETLEQLKRELSTGFKHDVETYMAVVRLLCDSGMNVRLNDFFMYVINKKPLIGFEISDLLKALIGEKLIKGVDVLVKVYASVGRFEEAIHTLSKIKSRGGLMVSTRTCNFVMNKLIELGKVDMVESIYRELKRNGLILNVYTYGILIKGHCRKGCLKEALEVFEQMEDNEWVLSPWRSFECIWHL